MSKGAFLGEFEHLVLAAIGHLDGKGYGVTILEEIRRRTGRTPTIGAVYTTLARLETKGYVRSWLGDATGERGGRAKRHFALRSEGTRALEASRRVLERMWKGLDLKPRSEGA